MTNKKLRLERLRQTTDFTLILTLALLFMAYVGMPFKNFIGTMLPVAYCATVGYISVWRLRASPTTLFSYFCSASCSEAVST